MWVGGWVEWWLSADGKGDEQEGHGEGEEGEVSFFLTVDFSFHPILFAQVKYTDQERLPPPVDPSKGAPNMLVEVLSSLPLGGRWCGVPSLFRVMRSLPLLLAGAALVLVYGTTNTKKPRNKAPPKNQKGKGITTQSTEERSTFQKQYHSTGMDNSTTQKDGRGTASTFQKDGEVSTTQSSNAQEGNNPTTRGWEREQHDEKHLDST